MRWERLAARSGLPVKEVKRLYEEGSGKKWSSKGRNFTKPSPSTAAEKPEVTHDPRACPTCGGIPYSRMTLDQLWEEVENRGLGGELEDEINTEARLLIAALEAHDAALKAHYDAQEASDGHQ